MREILFRGRLEDCDEWVEGFYIQSLNLIIDKSKIDWAVKSETVGQFTGLIDKNGKKIFEGDILVLCKGATYPYKIEWDGLGWKLYRSNGKGIKESFECDEIHHVKICEVIGNIFDNPELMEQSQ